MIKNYNGFKKEKMAGPREVIPAGGYVCKIMAAKVENYKFGDVLVLSFDITEGEYTGFFKRDWDNNTNPERKWRGNLRLNIPKGDGSEMDGWTVRSFNNFAASLEDSNPGYTWDWDESKLKGKELGILFRNREYDFNGNHGWTTEASSVTDSSAIREGKFRIPKDKPLKDKPVSDAPTYAAAEAEDDLPF